MEPGFPQTGTADFLYERIKDMTACRGTPSLHSCGEASKNCATRAEDRRGDPLRVELKLNLIRSTTSGRPISVEFATIEFLH